MQVKVEGETVVKVAETAEEAARLDREADVLRRVAHPGVVRLVRAESDRLVLARVAGSNLLELPPAPASVAESRVASWAAPVATVLADLHDIGWTHGNLRADHVLMDEEDGPVLCGFSRSARVAWGQTAGRGGDPRKLDEDMLVQLITEQCPTADSPTRRAVAGWERRRRRGGLRGLARELSALDQAPRRRSTGLRAVAACVATGAVLFALSLSGARSGRPAAVGSAAVPAYLLHSGGGTAISAIGAWDCGPARLAVLDRPSGQLWLFDSTPDPGDRVTARLVAQVSGATGLSAEVAGPGCDRLTVLRGSEPASPITLPAHG